MASGNLNKEIILLNEQLKNLGASTAEINAIQRAFKDLAGDTSAMSDEVDRVRSRVEQLKSEAENITTPFADLNKILQANASVLSKQNDTISISAKAQNKIANISRDMVNDYQGLADLSKRQLESKLDDLEASQSQLVLQAGIAASEAKSLSLIKDRNKAQDKRLEQLNEVAKFNAAQDTGLTGLIGKTKERLALETSINENMGVAGALVGGTGALMERLGMRSGIFNEAMDDATTEMRTMAKEMGTNVTFMNKLQVAATGVSKVMKGFGKALLDPTAIGLKLLDVFMKVNKQSVEISRLTGQTAANFDTSVGSAASMVDQMEVVADLTKQTGMSAQAAFSRENIQGAANLKVEMGLAADEAGNLAIMAQTSGTNVDDLTDSIVESTNEFNGTNKTAVAHGVILRDVAKASEGIRASFGGSTKELVAAAGAARKLGMEIGELDSIAGNLLDFESSIQSELEAQLLTGNRINMNKARELAMSNELGKLGDELFKNSASLAEFGEMNRFQQEAQAKALGMTKDQLAKVAYQRAINLGMSDEEIKNATGVEAADMRRITAQENFTKALEKIAASLAPILDFVGNILSIPWVPQILLGAVAVGKLGGNFKSMFKTATGGFKSMITGIKKAGGLMGSVFGKFYKGGQFMPGGDRAAAGGERGGGLFSNLKAKAKEALKGGGDKPEDKVKDLTGKLKDSSKSTKSIAPGKNIQVFFKNLSMGLKSMAGMKVLQGALNLIPASLGLVAMIPGVVGAKLMEVIGGPKLLLSMQSMAQGLTAMGTGKVLLGALGLTAAALAFTLMIPGSAGMALVGLTAPMAAAGIFALIPALTALGTAMMSGVGALGLAALIATAVGMGAAFALIGAGAMMFGKGIQYAAEGVSSIFSQLGGLVALLPSLYLLGPALMSIGAGLGMMAFMGIGAIPVIAALGGLALTALPLLALSGLFGGGEEEESGMGKIEEKLDTLIAVMASGGDVYLDSDKIGRTSAKNFSIITG
tara:strand:+ start:1000 stop:3969 length:2970 start_codon:yes stop_codon:yes gene_type:complete